MDTENNIRIRNMQDDKAQPKYIKFLFGGLAGMSGTLFVQPLDLLKNRMQLSQGKKEYSSSFQMALAIFKQEGLFGMYKGLSAGLLRQATYTTARLGIYQLLSDYFTSNGEVSISFAKKAVLGMSAGVAGSFVGTPAEVALIRMTGDGRLPPEQRRNYKNVFDAIIRIYKEEGLFALWRGAIPTMGRAMIVNAAQLATYSQAKEQFKKAGLEDGIFLHFCASMVSGLVTTICSMPVDMVKTRIQNMKVIDGQPEFSGALEVFSKVIKAEGFFALWKGFTPYYCRIGPHTVLTFIFLEQFNALYKKYRR